MCPRCEGMGQPSDIKTRSLRDGALQIPGYHAGGWLYRLDAEFGLVDPDKPIRDYSEQAFSDFLYEEPTRLKIAGINQTYEGLVPKIRKSMLNRNRDVMQKAIGEFVDHAVIFVDCPDCGGTRLARHALESKINGRNNAELCARKVSDLARWLRALQETLGSLSRSGCSPPSPGSPGSPAWWISQRSRVRAVPTRAVGPRRPAPTAGAPGWSTSTWGSP